MPYSNMDYKVVKYRKKKKCPLETYEPERKIRIRRETTVPLIVKIGHRFSILGGLIGFWASSFLLMLKGLFRVEERVKSFSLNRKTVEIRVKKR